MHPRRPSVLMAIIGAQIAVFCVMIIAESLAAQILLAILFFVLVGMGVRVQGGLTIGGWVRTAGFVAIFGWVVFGAHIANVLERVQ